METIKVNICKYGSRGDNCLYWQKLQTFDDETLYTHYICSYCKGECLSDGSKEHNSKV